MKKERKREEEKEQKKNKNKEMKIERNSTKQREKPQVRSASRVNQSDPVPANAIIPFLTCLTHTHPNPDSYLRKQKHKPTQIPSGKSNHHPCKFKFGVCVCVKPGPPVC